MLFELTRVYNSCIHDGFVFIGGDMGFFKKLTIKTQLIINALLTLVVIVTIFYLSYYKISQIVMNKNKEYTEEITADIQHNITIYYQEIKSILQNIGYDPNTQKIFSSNSSGDSFASREELKVLAINMVNIKKDIFDIAIIGENGKYFTMSGEYETVKKLMGSIPDDGEIHNTGFEKLERINSSDIIFFLYGMNFYSAYDSGSFTKKLGFTAILVDLNPLFQEIAKVSNNTEIKYYLMDKKGELYSPNDPLQINNNKEIIRNIMKNSNVQPKSQNVVKINGLKSIVMIRDIPEIEGKIVSIVPEKELLFEIAQARKVILVILFFALLLLSLLFTFITNNITQPVKKLIFFMNSLKSGKITNLKKKIQLEGYSEITVLAHEFNSMMDEINKLNKNLFNTTSKLYEAEIEKEKAELAFLRSQINPHFLYNTLEVIKGIALEEGVDKIFDMTKALALIFRYSVNGSNTVKLSEELRIVQAYVQIHTIRFGDRLEAEYETSDDSMDVTVLKMFLQPIVENAIYHGFEPKRGKGRLLIGSRIENKKLVIWVKDEGVGIDTKKMLEIQENLNDSSLFSQRNRIESKKGRIGLVNVNNRIKLTYGAEYGLCIESDKDKGTKVVITIPVEEENHV